MKMVGQLIELDPDKKYVMLIKKNVLSEEDIQNLALHLQKQQGALVAITLPEFDVIKFVENTDTIIDIQETKSEEEKTA